MNRMSSHDDFKPRRSLDILNPEQFETVPIIVRVFAYISVFVIYLVGEVREIISKCFGIPPIYYTDTNKEGYGPVVVKHELNFLKYFYQRFCRFFATPLCSVAGTKIKMKVRVFSRGNSKMEILNDYKEVINVASYNYLGFAEKEGPHIDSVEQIIREEGIGIGTTRHELGVHYLNKVLERTVARYLGVEDCIVYGMGFATNSSILPALMDRNCLVISDELNHASLILGCRLSKATIKKFKHQNLQDLERILRSSILKGCPETKSQWDKIFIVIEGLYSMEGTMPNLPEIIRLKKKYKAYLYVDEAHSIGAIGDTGRGVVEHYGCDPKDVDILMGTFTKSFAGVGGYICGSSYLIRHLKCYDYNSCYANSMSPPVLQRIICAIMSIMGEDGTSDGSRRLGQLKENVHYFRTELKKMGFIVYGDDASPVVPILFGVASIAAAVYDELLKNGIISVFVGFPATHIYGVRARLCLSAGHTREMLDTILNAFDGIGDKMSLKNSRRI